MQSSVRTLKKDALCRLLVERKQNFDEDHARGNPDRVLEAEKVLIASVKKVKTPVSKVNSTRLINVMYSEAMKLHQDDRAPCLTKFQLDNKEKSGDSYHKEFMDCYNDASRFNDDNYPDDIPKSSSSFQPPSVFTKIGDIKTFKDALNALLKAYEHCLNKQGRSGQHNVFEDLPFERYPGLSANREIMVYIHRSELECPGTRQKMVAELADGVGETAPGSKALTLKRNKRKPKHTEVEDDNSLEVLVKESQGVLQNALKSRARRAHRLELAVLEEQMEEVVSQIRKKTKSSNPEMSRKSVKKLTAQRLEKAYEAEMTKKKDADSGSTADDSDNGSSAIPESQETLYEKYVRARARTEACIDDANQQKKGKVGAQLKTVEEEENNKNNEERLQLSDIVVHDETLTPPHSIRSSRKRGSGGIGVQKRNESSTSEMELW
eukprot:scaffold3747_cov99-Cylindrotheca_fusiformis.AAC.5